MRLKASARPSREIYATGCMTAVGTSWPAGQAGHQNASLNHKRVQRGGSAGRTATNSDLDRDQRVLDPVQGDMAAKTPPVGETQRLSDHVIVEALELQELSGPEQ